MQSTPILQPGASPLSAPQAGAAADGSQGAGGDNAENAARLARLARKAESARGAELQQYALSLREQRCVVLAADCEQHAK